MLQYLPLSEQPLDIHLVSCIKKKFLSARRKSRSNECNAIFPLSLPDQLICFLPGWRKEVFLCKQFLFLVDVARNAFNGSLHGHCKNLVKIFHHDINIHKTFSCLLFQIFNTVISMKIRFSFKLTRGNFLFFSLAHSAIAQLSG